MPNAILIPGFFPSKFEMPGIFLFYKKECSNIHQLNPVLMVL